MRSHGLVVLVLALACGDDDGAPSDSGIDTMMDTGTDDAAGRDSDTRDTSTDTTTDTTADTATDTTIADASGNGTVTFIPIYEAGSAWDGNATARAMVDRVFADFSANLRTSGVWDATIEVYLTDDNTENANTSFDGFVDVDFGGQRVRVVPAWASIVQNVTNGPASPDGTNAEFTVHFNVGAHEDNDGLLRHEMMHGMGAVNRVPNFVVTDAGELTGPTAGDRIEAALYDLQLVDLDGNRLLGNYRESDGTFEVQPHRIELTLAEWMDGDGGIFFRGVGDDGAFDMSCGTFPLGPDRGAIVLNEPSQLMVASIHPTWDTIDQPDHAFLRALGYTTTP